MECLAWFLAALVTGVFLLTGLWQLALLWVAFVLLLALLDAAK